LWAAGIALRFRSIQAGPLMQTPVFLILFLAPVYVPFDLLQSWIQTAASINPITPIIEAVRGLIAGEPEKVPLAFGLGLGLVAAFMVWAVRGIRSAETAGG
jgi:ABC-2 type transport system permease protein